jgi:hypothetical protein
MLTVTNMLFRFITALLLQLISTGTIERRTTHQVDCTKVSASMSRILQSRNFLRG